MFSGRVLIPLSFLLLTGCPYQSSVPLSAPDLAKINSELIGKWSAEDKEGKEVGTVTISQFNERELLIIIDGGKDEAEAMRGFVTSVGSEKFLNVQEVTGAYEGREWMFVNYTVKDCSLIYRVVSDSLLKDKTRGVSSQKKLYDFIKKNVENKELYDEEVKLSRVKKSNATGK